MKYNFDEYIERRGTHSAKYDSAAERGLPADVLPLWVADMDFKVAPCITDALKAYCDHGIFGYNIVMDDYYEAARNWFSTYFNWNPKKEWLVNTPGVVDAVGLSVLALTQPGDHVLLTTPVYYPFYAMIRKNDRIVADCPLVYKDYAYSIDFNAFEQKIIDEQVKLFILCNPHNPTGRVWTKEELAEMGRICGKHGVYVVSDEIHCDFTFPGHEHTVFLNACPEMADMSIICTAASKSFNIAGLKTSNIWIPNSELRAEFTSQQERLAIGSINTMGMLATMAAYKDGREWFEQCRDYMQENARIVKDYLAENLPEVKMIEPEGTYFAWLDCSALGLSRDEINDRIINKAKIWLDEGALFGDAGALFQRIALACTKATLLEALERICTALKD